MQLATGRVLQASSVGKYVREGNRKTPKFIRNRTSTKAHFYLITFVILMNLNKPPFAVVNQLILSIKLIYSFLKLIHFLTYYILFQCLKLAGIRRKFI